MSPVLSSAGLFLIEEANGVLDKKLRLFPEVAQRSLVFVKVWEE